MRVDERPVPGAPPGLALMMTDPPYDAGGGSMSHQPVAHFSAEPSGRSASAEMVRARLFGVNVQRPKRIDRQIDCFGSGGVLRPVVNSSPRGDSSLDAALSRLLHAVLHVVKGAGGGRRPVIGF